MKIRKRVQQCGNHANATWTPCSLKAKRREKEGGGEGEGEGKAPASVVVVWYGVVRCRFTATFFVPLYHLFYYCPSRDSNWDPKRVTVGSLHAPTTSQPSAQS
jgi:hypothetical protein